MNIQELFAIIEDRKLNPNKESYVASLFRSGDDRIAQKVGEEAVEVVIASKNRDRQKFIEEFADLIFHSTVLLSAKGVDPEEVFDVLESRNVKKQKRAKK
jgi:phosphoribosyl-AMP cyclohydrolase / phosphoribosyl-ATP pyrophosphohydrolase